MLPDNERWVVDRIATIRVMGFTTLDEKDIPKLQSIAEDLQRLNGKCTSGCGRVLEEMKRMLEDDGK